MARRLTRRQAANPVSYRESSDSEAEESFEPEEDDYSTRPTKERQTTRVALHQRNGRSLELRHLKVFEAIRRRIGRKLFV